MLTETEARKRLARGLEFEPLSITVQEPPAGALRRARHEPDFVLAIHWQTKSRTFVAEYKSVPGTANLRSAVAQAKALASSNPDCLPLVLMPFLRKEALDELIATDVSGLDFCGNGVINVPGEWFAYRTGSPNQFPDSSPVVSPFRGNQSIVARAFLAQPAFGNQKALVQYLTRSGIAPSTVSKMLTALEQELLISKRPDIRLLRPDALLDRLRADYRAPASRRSLKVRFPESDVTWSRINERVNSGAVRYAISSPEQYTVLPRSASALRVLTNDIDALLAGVDYVVDERFPAFDLVETESRVPFFDTRFASDRWWTSPIEEYLELANGGKREAEAAGVIRKAILQAIPAA